jgi:hypothetical protein
MIKPYLSPKVILSTMLLACLLPLEETTPVVQALVIKRMDEVMSLPIVRTKSSMMQGPPLRSTTIKGLYSNLFRLLSLIL